MDTYGTDGIIRGEDWSGGYLGDDGKVFRIGERQRLLLAPPPGTGPLLDVRDHKQFSERYVLDNPKVAAAMPDYEKAVLDGKIDSFSAAGELLKLYRG